MAGVTSHPGYTARFADELKTPGVRVPLTSDPQLWSEAASLGRRVLWLHTYGQRFADPAQAALRRAEAPARPPPQGARNHPRHSWRHARCHFLRRDHPDIACRRRADRSLSPEAWAYETSGMKIIRKWFGYRKKNPAGRRSSPLDDINAEHWPARYTTELLELLNVLEMCAEIESRQADVLEQICEGPLITVADLGRGGLPGASRRPETAPTRVARHTEAPMTGEGVSSAELSIEDRVSGLGGSLDGVRRARTSGWRYSQNLDARASHAWASAP